MKFFTSSIILSIGTAITSTSAAPQPPPILPPLPIDLSQVYITDFTYAGSGCPPGSIAQARITDWTDVTITFDQYAARIGPGVPITENSKNCDFNISLHSPLGFRFSVYETSYSGFTDLQDKVQATQQSDFWLVESPAFKASLKNVMVGPVNDTYTLNALKEAETAIRKCNKNENFIFSSAVTLNNRANLTADGFSSIGYAGQKAVAKLRAKWESCF